MKSSTTRLHEVRPASRRFDLSRLHGRLACRLLFAWQRFRRWRAARQAIRHLHEIDDYLLEDVGINRWDIAEIVHGKKGYQQTADRQISSPPLASPCDRLAA